MFLPCQGGQAGLAQAKQRYSEQVKSYVQSAVRGGGYPSSLNTVEKSTSAGPGGAGAGGAKSPKRAGGGGSSSGSSRGSGAGPGAGCGLNQFARNAPARATAAVSTDPAVDNNAGRRARGRASSQGAGGSTSGA